MRIRWILIAVVVFALFAARERTRPAPEQAAAVKVEGHAEESIKVPMEVSDDPDSTANQVSASAKDDPVAAAAWAKEEGDPLLRERLVVGVATVWADEDPIRAAEFLLESVPAGQAQENAVLGIVQRMAAKDLAAADEWVGRFPDGVRERAVAELRRIRQRQLVLVHE